jgi:two-component system, OmpR family, sensor histidine kinase KdpD
MAQRLSLPLREMLSQQQFVRETPLKKKRQWKRYVNDSLLALGSIFLLTGIIFLFHLSLKIPDSLLLYLLVILALAGLRGSYAALLAAFIAFFSFDFFFVPPFYSLIITKFEDFFALIVFLVTAIMTGQLTSALRYRIAQLSRKERETRILYDLVRATNREENMERQLQIFVRAVEEIFSSWGVLDCMLLLPDTVGKPALKISALQAGEQGELSREEEEKAAWVMEQGLPVDIRGDTPVSAASPTRQLQNKEKKRNGAPSSACSVRLIPLKTDQKVLGVLRLLIAYDAQSPAIDTSLGMENGLSTPQAVFFRTFLEQAVALIERGRLQRESLRIEVLQQTDALRAALLSSVSHDLRTPLSAIMTAATSLQHKEAQCDEETSLSLALLIEHEAKRLNRLVENLLDMSRIESGALRPNKVCYPLDELVRDVLGRLHLLLQGRALQLSLPDGLPVVELDYIQIDQVVTNLLENAARYTPAGSPLDIDIGIQGEWVQVRIADRGPGIPATERERVFDKFYRVLGNAAGQVRGSGLGLAVCKGLIEAHGGRIWVEPREGGGAIFCFLLSQKKGEGKSQ